MPLYTFHCSECATNEDIFSKIDSRDAPRLGACGHMLSRRLAAPHIRPEIQAFASPVTGEWVNSRAQHREDLKRSNSIPWEPGMREDFARKRADDQEKRYQQVDKKIDEAVASLNAVGAFST